MLRILRRKNPKPCKCGARTPREHLQAILTDWPVHVYTGPERQR
jgi:hypothetical protein